MTYTLKVRGAPGPMTAEYLCPVHGVFEVTVERNEGGDVPDKLACPASCEPSGEVLKVFWQRLKCNQPSPWTLTAPPAGRVRATEVVRGKGDPAPTPMALDTRALGEGMPLSEWKARRAKMWGEHDYKQLKEER